MIAGRPCHALLLYSDPSGWRGDKQGQPFACMDIYNTKRWREVRKRVLIRDRYMDQILLADGIQENADTVHHILPVKEFPEYAFADWNLIAVNERRTHRKRLHDMFGKLTKFGETLMQATAHAHGVRLGMVTMVVGLPGSGKSTYAKAHLGGGLCYELDAIASAFRLRVPHEEPEGNADARRMAAALRRGWLAEVKKYTKTVFIVRTAPDIDELEETRPDRIVICWKRFAERPYQYDKEEYGRRLKDIEAWAMGNGVEVERYPRGSNKS